MADARTEIAPPAHAIIRRDDYRPPHWLVPEIELDFSLDPEATRVKARLTVVRNGEHDRPLRLNGDQLAPLAVRVNGGDGDWRMEGSDLLVNIAADRATVETEVELRPAGNTKLMGLYESGGMLCTQCEAEGFRRITFFPDRPDVLSRYLVRLEADKSRFPVLLTNGNPVAAGEGADGRHWAEWEDPFPKPCYLFALVAGDLQPNRDSFTTMSGRQVDLAIWVRAEDLPRTGHAMESLKQSMAWDERVYGREYDLDQFNIVAVSDFNMGAMENKGLNIFNTKYILADADTATDQDFDGVAAVVAHEYFHNWSGNRVTCRDWFQLSLKEGFTVFRDQCFSADIGSAAVKRIEDVRVLRAVQFAEDASPLAHAVRPDSYVEISNFYTATVYNKGAELIRMLHTVLGPDKYRAGTDLYFERHDGEAATCDDFVKALEDASSVDLSAFKRWYEQAGTPQVSARLDYDAESRSALLQLAQTVPPTPGQAAKRPMPLPLRTALIGEASGAEIAPEQVILLSEAEQSIRFDNIDEPPLLSINRGFSAPVIVAADRRPGELERLAQTDTDPFARYQAIQDMMLAVLLASARGETADLEPLTAALRNVLRSNALDSAFKGEAILLPSEGLIADRMEKVDPDAIHAAREGLREHLGRSLMPELLQAQAERADGLDLTSQAKGVRRFRTVALNLIAGGDHREGARLAKAQFDAADSMTDRQGALIALTSLDGPERLEAFDAFYRRYQGNALVIDKWFGLQAMAQRSDTIDEVERLAGHGDFTLSNPNRVRALFGSFAANQWVLHGSGGRGYRLLADTILKIDPLNPQLAASLVPKLARWRRFEPNRAELMRAELERIVGHSGLSKDVYEQASKSLA